MALPKCLFLRENHVCSWGAMADLLLELGIDADDRKKVDFGPELAEALPKAADLAAVSSKCCRRQLCLDPEAMLCQFRRSSEHLARVCLLNPLGVLLNPCREAISPQHWAFCCLSKRKRGR